jgi:hypothetical protein
VHAIHKSEFLSAIFTPQSMHPANFKGENMTKQDIEERIDCLMKRVATITETEKQDIKEECEKLYVEWIDYKKKGDYKCKVSMLKEHIVGRENI